ncbi:MAG: MerR family transcriptional regulator [Bryobacteraceae bacterium]
MFKTKRRRPEPATPEPFTTDASWSSTEVAKLGGVSLRQLQWWDEQKVVSPRHEGHRRVYSAAEVVEIAVIAELRRKGFSLQKIRRVVRYLQREMGKRLAEVLSGESEMHLLTDGKAIMLEDSEHRVVDVLKNARQAMFLVCVSDQARRITQLQRKPVRRETAAPTTATRRLKASGQ